MKIRYISITKTVMILVVFTLVGCSKAGNASEQWDARTTARVNLRKHPHSNAVILSIVPESHKLRIMEQDGLWFKVDVAGKIHGKGWVHGHYVEKLIEATADTETASKDFRSETVTKDHNQGAHFPEMFATDRTGDEKVKPPDKTLAEARSTAVDIEGASGIPTPRDGINEAGAVSKAEIPIAEESALPDVQVPREVPEETDSAERLEKGPVEDVAENGLKDHLSVRYALPQKKDVAGASSKPENPVAGDPLHLASSQTPAESSVEDKRPKPLNASSSDRAPIPALEATTSVPNKLQDAKNEPGILYRPETSGAGKSVHTPPVGLPHTGSDQDARRIKGKNPSKSIELDVAALDRKSFHGKEIKHNTGTRETPLPVTKKAVTDAREPVSPEKIATSPLERKGPAIRAESMGPVRIALKLLSIILSCSVILLLYLENKGVV